MKHPESRLQMRVRMYLDAHLPAPGWWSSVGHERKQSLRSGQLQKARGVKRGLSDVMIWYRGQFFGVELKAGSAISESQAAFGAAMEANDFKWVVIWSVEQLDDYLRANRVPLAVSARIDALRHDAALEATQPAPKAKRGGAKPRTPRPSSRALAIATQAQLPGWRRS